MRVDARGCGALFPSYDGPTHRYLGASAACWALFHWHVVLGEADATDLLSRSRVPEPAAEIPAWRRRVARRAVRRCLWRAASRRRICAGRPVRRGSSTRPSRDHRGEDDTTGLGIGRALRKRGVFHKLSPPALGSALTIRHLFPGGGVPLSGHAHAIRPVRVRGMDVASSLRPWSNGTSAMSPPTSCVEGEPRQCSLGIHD